MQAEHWKILAAINALWPELRGWVMGLPGNVRFLDSKYERLTVSGYNGMLTASKTNLRHFMAEVGDCDDFAEIVLAEIRKARWLEAVAAGVKKGRTWPFAIGRCDGNFHHVAGMHRMLIAYATDGLWLIEPQTDEIMAPDPKADHPIYIEF